MYQRSKLPIVGKPTISKGSARHERALETRLFKLGTMECDCRCQCVARAFTELLSAFNRKLGEISGDRVCIHLANPAIDRGFTEVRPGRVAGETG